MPEEFYTLPKEPESKPSKICFVGAVFLLLIGVFFLWKSISTPLVEHDDENSNSESFFEELFKSDPYNDQLSVLTNPSMSEITGCWKLRQVVFKDSKEIEKTDNVFELTLNNNGEGNYRFWKIPDDSVIGLQWNEMSLFLLYYENEDQYYYEFNPKYNKYDDTLVLIVNDIIFKFYRQQ